MLTNGLAHDLRFALRSLRRSPTYAITAVLTLALAIGAAAAAFSVLDAIRFRALPFPDADRLVVLGELPDDQPAEHCGADCQVAYETYADVLARGEVRALDAVGAYVAGGKSLDVGDDAVLVTGGVMSPSMFELLHAQAALGRVLTAEDDRLGTTLTTVLSWDLWTNRFGADPDILGRVIKLSDSRYTVVGVMPSDFDFESNVDFWLAAVPTLDPSTLPSIRSVTAFGRLAPGRTLPQLRDELASVHPAPAGDGAARTRLEAVPLRTRYADSTGSHDLVFAAIVATILLIACANLANLALVRTLGQQRDFAVRAALGAGADRLARFLLLQQLVVVAAATALGLVFASRFIDVLASLPTLASIRATGMAYRIDVRVVAFAVGVALVAAVLLSVLPALVAMRMDVQRVLRSGSASAASGRGLARTQRIFVVAQVASAAVLLIGGGLMTRTVLRLAHVDLGFDAAHLLEATPSLPHPWRVPETYLPLSQRILEEMAAMPGVRSVALRAAVPLRGRGGATTLTLQGHAEPLPGALAPPATISVSPGYFETVGVAVVRGRTLAASDDESGEPVALVNETAARVWWQGEDPVGSSIELASPGAGPETVRIVGVVADNRAATGGLVLSDVGPELYRPYRQASSPFPTFLLRAGSSPAALTRATRALLVREVPDRPLFTSTSTDRVAGLLGGVRTNALQILAFAAVGLLLALVGVYGVLSYATGRRTAELALRAAVGATRARNLRTVLLDALRLAAIALAVGVPAAALAAPTLTNLLHGTDPRDPGVYGAVAVLVLVLSLLASWVPALRASRVDPAAALRGE